MRERKRGQLRSHAEYREMFGWSAELWMVRDFVVVKTLWLLGWL